MGKFKVGDKVRSQVYEWVEDWTGTVVELIGHDRILIAFDPSPSGKTIQNGPISYNNDMFELYQSHLNEQKLKKVLGIE